MSKPVVRTRAEYVNNSSGNFVSNFARLAMSDMGNIAQLGEDSSDKSGKVQQLSAK